MKKTLLLAGVLSLLLTVNTSFATDVAQAEKSTVRPEIKKCQECKKPPKFDKQKQEEFQNKLGLTDEQKAKAKQIHENGREQMKPVMEKMKAKHDEIKAIKDNAALSEEEKTAQIEQQVKELKALKQHSRELQMKNMKEFEGILTKDQQKTLEKMKEEGRKNFDKEFKKRHHAKPPVKPGLKGDVALPTPVKPILKNK